MSVALLIIGLICLILSWVVTIGYYVFRDEIKFETSEFIFRLVITSLLTMCYVWILIQ